MSKQKNNMKLLMGLSTMQSKLEKRLNLALSVHGISLSEFMVLHQLATAPSHCMSRIALANAVHLSASGVTRLLNPLEKMHIVEKQKNARDARVSLVHLTDVGFESYENARQTYAQTAELILNGVDLATLNSVVGTVNLDA